MSRKRRKRRRGITPWKKTALKVCVLWLVLAASIHAFRTIKAAGFEDQREAARWGSSDSCAQVSAFLPSENALKEENIRDLEYKINSALAQDSIKLTAQGEDARLWQDCYSGIGSLTLAAGSKTVKVEAVGTGGAFFTFHPLHLSSGSFYLSDSPMKDEILLDQETAWKLFGSFNVVGRSVRVEDMYLRIAGVYKKEEGGLYENGGLSDYVVFVQYTTLLQYGGTGKNTGNGTAVPSTASSPAALFVATEGPVKNTENGSDGQEGTSSGSEQNSENVGTGNTRYTDTGMITTYEIVMPDPVDGYAAAAVMHNMSLLARYLNKVQKKGYTIGIISWTSKGGSDEYHKNIDKVKRTWLRKHLPSVIWDEIRIVKYGINKYNECGGGILFDDEEKNRNDWHDVAYKPDEIFSVLKRLIKEGE